MVHTFTENCCPATGLPGNPSRDCGVRSSDGSSVVTVPEVRWRKLPIAPTLLIADMPEPLRIIIRKRRPSHPFPTWNMSIVLLDWHGWLVVYGAISYSFRDLFLREGGRNAWKFLPETYSSVFKSTPLCSMISRPFFFFPRCGLLSGFQHNASRSISATHQNRQNY